MWKKSTLSLTRDLLPMRNRGNGWASWCCRRWIHTQVEWVESRAPLTQKPKDLMSRVSHSAESLCPILSEVYEVQLMSADLPGTTKTLDGFMSTSWNNHECFNRFFSNNEMSRLHLLTGGTVTAAQRGSETLRRLAVCVTPVPELRACRCLQGNKMAAMSPSSDRSCCLRGRCASIQEDEEVVFFFFF